MMKLPRGPGTAGCRKLKKQTALVAKYEQAVRDSASGTEVDANSLSKLLDRLDIDVIKFEADVALEVRRSEWRATAAELPTRQAKVAEAIQQRNATKAHYDAASAALHKEAAERVNAAEKELQRAQWAVNDCNDSMQRLGADDRRKAAAAMDAAAFEGCDGQGISPNGASQRCLPRNCAASRTRGCWRTYTPSAQARASSCGRTAPARSSRGRGTGDAGRTARL